MLTILEEAGGARGAEKISSARKISFGGKTSGGKMGTQWRIVPQRLKPTMICAACGMAEAMPFQSNEYFGRV
jgi:hypothetical protein